MVTGLDLVAEQIRVAEGHPLRLTQDDISVTGHALECRVNAEDWQVDFRPSPGTVTAAVFPVGDHVRVDTHIQSDAAVPPYYDSLLAKVIVHGSNRDEAMARMTHALRRCRIEGVATTLDLHRRLVEDDEMCAGGVDTMFFTRFLARQETLSDATVGA